jgi:predicted phosphodiesterase
MGTTKKTIVISDLHVEEDALEEVENIIDEICKEKADRCIQLGDFCDKPRLNALELATLTRICFKLKQAFKEVIILVGNHDALYKDVSILDYLQFFNIQIISADAYVDDQNICYGHFFTDKSNDAFGKFRYSVADLEKKYKFTFLGHQHCVSSDTEILTENGWKHYNELIINEKIASFNMETQKVEYVNLENLFTYNYDGEMYDFANRALVTPNHRMILAPKHSHKCTIKYAYTIKQVDRLLLNHIDWEYPILHEFDNPYWAEMVGFIIGDGSYGNINTNHFEVCIKQKYGFNTISYLPNLLTKCNLEYSETSKNSIYRRFRIKYTKDKNRKFLDYLKQHVKEKDLTRELVSLPKEQLQYLFNGLIQSDGHFYHKNSQMFSQKDKKVIDLFEELCLKLGKKYRTYARKAWRTNAIQYQVNVFSEIDRKKQFFSLSKKNIKKQTYSGLVWCPQNKNGTWIARRNGKPFITGNSAQKVSNKVCHLGSSRFVSFGENPTIAKRYAVIENNKIQYKTIKSVIPMYSISTIEELKSLPERSKVRYVFNSFKQLRDEIEIVEKYKSKFHKFQKKLNFTIETKVVETKEAKSNKDIITSWLSGIKDVDMKQLLTEEFQNEFR